MRIGIDLGGSNLRLGVVDDAHRVGYRDRCALGADRSPAAIVELVATRVARAVAAVGEGGGAVHAVGVGIAALLRDRAGTVARSPHLDWTDVPFGDLVRARLGDGYRVRVDNDVNAIAWGEHVAGAARGCRDALVVYVGTGIGGGVIANGALVDGATFTAGEIGHTKVAWGADAAPCACGSRGCVEAYVGGSYVLRRLAAERPGLLPDAIDALAAAGDDAALALWSELAPLLAIALGNAVALLNPARLVLGGGLLARTPTLLELTIASLELVAPRAALERLAVVAAELGDDAGLIGAADLATKS